MHTLRGQNSELFRIDAAGNGRPWKDPRSPSLKDSAFPPSLRDFDTNLARLEVRRLSAEQFKPKDDWARFAEAEADPRFSRFTPERGPNALQIILSKIYRVFNLDDIPDPRS